ncbi:MAG TPA: hypothetical protein VMW16_01735 [Sedimentisphaerales bacterium]|nr:hypothetical protein [Sedimentisphaerales bacterium]
MSPPTNQQKLILFDYCVGFTSEQEAAEAEELIAASEEAAAIYHRIKATLAPLDTLKEEPCPDQLVESTVWRLNNLARASQLRLEQLLEAEQARNVTFNTRAWWNFGKMAAAAAVVLIVLGTWFAPLDFIRQKCRESRCRMQLARIFQGLSNYIADHDGQMPAVATTAGSPWWKVGYQGQENHSATRNMWLLVKGNYADPADFVCPAKRRNLVIRFDPSKMQAYNDFPSRDDVSYSVRIMYTKSKAAHQSQRKVLIADLSPLFENLPKDFSKSFQLVLDEDLLIINSSNHNRRGQNVLFCDGSIKFLKKRHTDISYDDIFTLWEMHAGSEVRGCEVPSCETDAFLAP